MIDRESIKVLTNGAVRYGIYDENGTLLRYEYIKLEDEPTVAGSIYSKANVLPDAVCEALDVPVSSEPKDAFLKLREMAREANMTDYEKFVFGRFW